MKYFMTAAAHNAKMAIWKAFFYPIAIFGNNEDGWFGDKTFNPKQEKTIWFLLSWFIRNPFHNLCFHIFGFSDKRTELIGSNPPNISNPSNDGWLWHLVRPIDMSDERLFQAIVYLAAGMYLSDHDLPYASMFISIATMCGIAGTPIVPLPFISYASDYGYLKRFYIGWRASGAFGIKFQINSAKLVADLKSLLHIS